MFCECGAFIHFPLLASENIICKRCSMVIEEYKPVLVTTVKNFTHKEEQVQDEVKGAKIKMDCPQCGNKEMLYNTAQLRSADEGQTVFYTCDKCGYKEIVQS